jgi:hypothetical protein
MSDGKSKTTASSVGYSGKALWQKLGLKPGMRVRLCRAPPDYWALCGFDAAGIETVTNKTRPFDLGHLFATARGELERELAVFAHAMPANGTLWISWPKKTSGVATDITESTLREVALPLGLVDVKVCAVTEIWSGLKFVWRQELRSRLPSSQQ